MPTTNLSITVNVTSEEKETMLRLAKADGRSLSGYLRWLVRKEDAKANNSLAVFSEAAPWRTQETDSD